MISKPFMVADLLAKMREMLSSPKGVPRTLI